MQRKVKHQEQQGFLSIAQNTEDVDYLKLAYVQAMSIKGTMPGSKYAVLVDDNTMLQVTDQHRKVFDYIILIENDFALNESWKLSNEWQVFYLTPFKETIKVESDILFTRSISHWWNAFRLRNIVLSTGCRDFKQNISTSRAYRKLFDDNQLPDIYSGLMYFRYTQEATHFFKIAEMIFKNWDIVKSTLKLCYEDKPTTDVVYAITTNIIGPEICTIPSTNFINFVHLKSAINKWPSDPWTSIVISEMDLPMIRINNTNQYHPLHYYDKSLITDEVVKEYEKWMNF